MTDFTLPCPAKINLGLSIGAKLDKGYHQVETIMAKIPLCDYLYLRFMEGRRVFGMHGDLEGIPQDQSNLVFLAWNLLSCYYQAPSVDVIVDKKNIPIGAGLGGGGSSNAGCVLSALNQHCHLGVPESEIKNMAVFLGADLPFFAQPHSVVYEKNHGLRSLESHPLPSLPPCKIVLLIQDFSLSTPQMYQRFDELKKASKPASLQKLLQAVKKQDLEQIGKHLHNDFQDVLLQDYPQLELDLVLMKKLGCLGCGFTGKGPTIFGLFPPEAELDLASLNRHVILVPIESSHD